MSQPPITWIMEALGKKEKHISTRIKAKIFSWLARPFQHRNGPEAPAFCRKRAASDQLIYPNHGLINYIDTKARFRHPTNCNGTFQINSKQLPQSPFR
jgi:hypothetical protein